MSLAPSPFDFQRIHCHAINVRLATVYVRSKILQRHYRLYHQDKPSVVHAANLATEHMHTLMMQQDGGSGGGNNTTLSLLPSSHNNTSTTATPDNNTNARVGLVDVFFGSRQGTNPEDCSASAIPFELEVVRAPPLGMLDNVAAASVTLGSFYSAAAITPSLYQSIENGQQYLYPSSALSANNNNDIDNSSSASAIPSSSTAVQHIFAMEEGEFASHMSSGGAPVPAPSALPTISRAHPASANQIYADYTAHTELILSPYFADTCGLHEADDGGITSVLGAASLFCYEYIPSMIPLSQLLMYCGRLPENRLYFSYLICELVKAFADIEAQCSFTVAPGSITTENIYVSEKGSRITLRGIAWGDPIPPDRDATELMLINRSKILLRTFGEIIRDILVESTVTKHIAEDSKYVKESEGGQRAMTMSRGSGEQDRARAGTEARQQLDVSRARIAQSHRRNGGNTNPANNNNNDDDNDDNPYTEYYNHHQAEFGIQTAIDSTVHIVLPNSLETLNLSSSSSSSSSANTKTQSSQRPVWLGPLIQFKNSNPGEYTTKIAEEALATFIPGQTVSGTFTEGGLPVCVNDRFIEPVNKPSGNSTSTNLSSQTRFILQALHEGELTVWFYLVDTNSSSAVASNQVKNDRRPPGDNDTVRSLTGMLLQKGFAVVRPHTDDVLTSIMVPLQVYPRNPSSVLSALLDACDPRPEESAAVASLRLLSALVAQRIGMVNGKKIIGGSLASTVVSSNKKSKKITKNSSDNLTLSSMDQIHDDETFLVIIRKVAAVLRLNRADTTDVTTGTDPNATNGNSFNPSSSSSTELTKTTNAASTGGGSGGGGATSTDVNDVDALAALINAMETVSEGTDGIVSPFEGAIPRGGTTIDADMAAAQLRAEGSHHRKNIQWISHLARHPYFTTTVFDTTAIMDDYTAYAYPLAYLSSRLVNETSQNLQYKLSNLQQQK